jgi:hypothetical protein
MAMLYAGSDEFRERFPHGGKPYDANGSQIIGAIACDPETGKVFRIDRRYSPISKIFAALGFNPVEQPWIEWAFPLTLHLIHAFHPAPLTIVPNDPPAQE